MQRRAGREQRDRQRPQQRERHRPAQGAARPPADPDERADDRAGAEGREHVAEDGDVPVLVARHDRAEDEQRRERDEQRDAERGERRPDPRARADLVEAGAHVGEQRRAVQRCGGRGRLATLARAHAREQHGADEERRGVDREGGRGAEPEHERGRQRGAGELRDVREHRRDGVGLLDLVLGHRLGQQAGRRGAVERLGRSEEDADDHEVPDADLAGDDQQRQQRVQRKAREVGRDDEPVARQAVGDDAADEQEADERQAVGRQHEAEVGRAARQVDDEQRERDADDVVAERARRVGEPQQAKVAVAKDSQQVTQGGHGEQQRASAGAARRSGFEPRLSS